MNRQQLNREDRGASCARASVCVCWLESAANFSYWRRVWRKPARFVNLQLSRRNNCAAAPQLSTEETGANESARALMCGRRWDDELGEGAQDDSALEQMRPRPHPSAPRRRGGAVFLRHDREGEIVAIAAGVAGLEVVAVDGDNAALGQVAEVLTIGLVLVSSSRVRIVPRFILPWVVPSRFRLALLIVIVLAITRSVRALFRFALKVQV